MNIKNKEQNKQNRGDEDMQLCDTCYLLKSVHLECFSLQNIESFTKITTYKYKNICMLEKPITFVYLPQNTSCYYENLNTYSKLNPIFSNYIILCQNSVKFVPSNIQLAKISSNSSIAHLNH